MPKLKVSLGIGFANANQSDVIDIDEAEWKACETEQDKDALINEYAKEWAWEYIDLGAVIQE